MSNTNNNINELNNDTNNNTNNDDECFICYNKFKNKDKKIKLDCEHIFHKKCLILSLEYMGKTRQTNSLICSYCSQIHLIDINRYSIMKLKRNINNLIKLN